MPDAYEAPPFPVTWTALAPVEHGGKTYSTITLSPPTAGQILLAIAKAPKEAPELQGAMAMISAASEESWPLEALAKLPAFQIQQMAAYLDQWALVGMPIPLRPKVEDSGG